MPLYEYRCTQCNHRFDVYHHVGGTAGPCPVCGGPAKRIFSPVGLIFKGSGFHTTDYRRSPSPDGAKSGSGKSSEGTAKGEASGSGKSSEGAAKGEASGSGKSSEGRAKSEQKS